MYKSRSVEISLVNAELKYKNYMLDYELNKANEDMFALQNDLRMQLSYINNMKEGLFWHNLN